MALRNIFVEGEPILNKKCKKVAAVDDRIREQLDDMLETMKDSEGVGIAAPQVGLLKRMCILEPEPDKVYYLINPEIVGTMGEQEGYEGCLSVPGLIGKVKRPLSMKVNALDYDGVMKQYTFKDFEAVVASHEIDHLDGILYTQKAEDIHDPALDEKQKEE
ncbi:MAG: peptide deformylase [Firmicutes bacterium]|nr:peptide deformylase [Bacillota bacterium]